MKIWNLTKTAYRQGLIISLFCLVGASAACNFKDEKGNAADQTVTIDPTAAVGFAEIQTKILQPYCVGCHSAAAGNSGKVNLETYAAVTASGVIDRIKSSTIVSRRMPPEGPLSGNDIALLKAWIDQGAPEAAK